MELARRLKSSNQSDDQLGNQNLVNEPQFGPSQEADIKMSSDTESDKEISSNDESDEMEVDCVTLRKSR